ncbi:MAG: Gfo/Idh/MocA family oxidoreductase [Rhodobacteraceae bacterium]|nr:Gfo/Idh/MocA family oxidoreductase [Paracoccaceae bacterium]MCF8521035.1 Gfo/Idh/MocA family oxidoreductase [Paracoccaceae bacterium]
MGRDPTALIVTAFPPVSPKGLRTAVIGLGRMGMRHVQAAESLGMTVIGGADLSAEARAILTRDRGVPTEACFADGAEMLAALHPEALVVATTAPSHAPFVLAAVEAGVRHILCEKPMASSFAQADAMLAACASSGTRLAVNHQMRFMDQYTEVKALLGSKALGPLSSVAVAAPNFGLAMNASHYFEMFRYLTDEPVANITAWFEAEKLVNPRAAAFDDASGRLLARTASGTAMYLDFSANSGWGVQVVYSCKYGQIIVDELRGEMKIAARQAEYRALPTTHYGMPVDVEHRAIAPAYVVTPTAAVWTAMLAGTDLPNGAAGAHTLRCLVAAHASHRAGGVAVGLDSAALPRDEIFHWA